MSEPVYKLGDAVHTPAHGDGVVVMINRGTIRGRMWREISYTIKTPGSSHAVVYYETELTSLSPSK
jgi:RNA polymerase-interacting CarD/CdnL/TRCF family regulator